MTEIAYVARSARVGLRAFRPEEGPEFTPRARESTAPHRPWLFPPTTAADCTAYERRPDEDPARAGHERRALTREMPAPPVPAATG
ncbi:hypothetical protein [Streptomyces sp. NPDC090022]|uniref:hypothetical protein n=1 Tax=Streptomyces sp. NPDC090022 TaxID=3365920 RepID=UPI003802E19A